MKLVKWRNRPLIALSVTSLLRNWTPPSAVHLALFYVGYVVACAFSRKMQIIPGHTTAFWPAAGLFIACLLTTPRQSWPWWVIVGCAAELTANVLWFRNSLPAALGFFTANACEAVAAAWLLLRFVKDPFRLKSPWEVLGFLVLGAGIAPVIGATIGCATHQFLGTRSFSSAWLLWWLGDASGLLVTTPITLAVLRSWQNRAEVRSSQIAEALLLAGTLLVIGVLAFKGYLPTVYALLPPLLWAAVRFQIIGAAASLGSIAWMSAAFTVSGHGEFAGTPSEMEAKVIALKSFLALSAISAMLVAALSFEHQRALSELQAANDELETRVTQRTKSLVESEEHLRLVMREVDHRSKNLLALVLAVARQTIKSSPTDFMDRFSDRMQALAASHDVLVKSNWKGANLHQAVRSQLQHFADLIDRRITITGPDVIVSSSAAQSLGMVIHELATNASKYGALSSDQGRVAISWTLGGGNGEESFELTWSESDGPPVAAPSRKGFGSMVTTSFVKASLNADVAVDFAPGGLVWKLRCGPARLTGTV